MTERRASDLHGGNSVRVRGAGRSGRKGDETVETRTLGDFKLAPDVEDEINYNSGDHPYMVLRAEDDDHPVYGEATFADSMGRANSDANWAETAGKLAIVVDLSGVLRLAWTALPVLRETTDEEEN